MPEQKINKTGSDAEQMLRDLLKSAGEAGKHKLVGQIAAILANPEFNKSVATNTDKIYNARQYKDLRFVQTVALQETNAPGILATLSTAELQLFMFLERIAPRGLFQITYTQAEQILGISRSSIYRAFTKLINKKILYVVKPATNKTAAIYRINSYICRAGKGKSKEQDLKDLENIADWDVWEKRMTAESMVFSEGIRIGLDGKKLRYNTLDYDYTIKEDQSDQKQDEDGESEDAE